MRLLTLAEIRDEVRRMVGMTPPYDVSGDPMDKGKAPSQRPDPSNPVIDGALSRAIARANLVCDLHLENDVTIPVKAAPADWSGPLYVPLVTQGGLQQVNRIRRVAWQAGAGSSGSGQAGGDQLVTLLAAHNMMADDRDGYPFDNREPGFPAYYVLEGWKLGVCPAPQTDGTLRIYCGTAFIGPLQDTDRIDQVPADWQPFFLNGTIVEIAQRLPYHAEWQARLQVHQPLWQEGLALIQRQQFLLLAEQQPHLSFGRRTHQANSRRVRS